MALRHAPRPEVVGGHRTVEARLLGCPRESQEFGRGELLMRSMKANTWPERHDVDTFVEPSPNLRDLARLRH